ncbi:location of vulva defective 1-like [Eupeodes corollae]|uniref:location of vulva defective 1-like n=1 Tax=Eupeodes corollae TaxID=290404 RepID=UPI002492A661|nr:location of vulva defective 1-like [Eupeodes corollae]
MKFVTILFIFSASFYTVYTLCNTCSAITNTACVANDQFSICVDGLPTSSVTQCPNGTVCTASASICSPAETTQASCGMCGVCNGNSSFACMSYNSFALCYGSSVPDTVNINLCANSTVCVYDDPHICVDPTMTGIGGTCPAATANTTTTTTTTMPTTTSTTVNPAESTTISPTIDPLIFCANVTNVGRFEITTDINCKQYIFCDLVNSTTWVGNVYECPGSTLFNSTTGFCGVEVPLRCATTIT